MPCRGCRFRPQAAARRRVPTKGKPVSAPPRHRGQPPFSRQDHPRRPYRPRCLPLPAKSAGNRPRPPVRRAAKSTTPYAPRASQDESHATRRQPAGPHTTQQADHPHDKNLLPYPISTLPYPIITISLFPCQTHSFTLFIPARKDSNINIKPKSKRT